MSPLPRLKQGESADVALLLEGTYPYVSGGVSSWVHQIITALPEFTFALIFIGSDPSHYAAPRYVLPPNVVHLSVHYLANPFEGTPRIVREGNPDAFRDVEALHDALKDSSQPIPDALWERVAQNLGKHEGLPAEDFIHSRRSWEQIIRAYERDWSEGSFVDYFWTVRTIHAPLFRLAEVARQVPRVRMLHSISTGYAGALAALLQRQRGLPFILSEHGIYTKERKIDLSHVGWIQDRSGLFSGESSDGLGHLRRLWIRFFEGLGRMTYQAADPIIALYEGNRARQVQDGADAARTHIIPNGIDIARFAPLRQLRGGPTPPIIGLLGRIVPIKDVRTFIRTMSTVAAELPEAEGWIIGPEDENPAYARECRELVRNLGLESRVRFLGFQKPEELLPKLGLLMLTSISEALPLVVLEAFASGLPVVCTDVGSCRELVEGRPGDDAALGSAGAVVPITSPEEAGRAALRLLKDAEVWRAAQGAGIARVERWYSAARMIDSYRAVYRGALEGDRGGDRIRASSIAQG
ncbi:DUF3492 domain-containing protein [Corallococcus sp. CA054B]|uniref:GT4 family glycosyltransferase PelF n=1 Tax=Corallococcus sp. CA054B TaxID=2316734 RepID=UPI000EA3B585|nr:GT4 family glycosyltransferase PelF [Corallococcus sp. CA054B]RKG66503.1 DUF3492 domain-containing protein [Corallococcus sp. CA054B]